MHPFVYNQICWADYKMQQNAKIAVNNIWFIYIMNNNTKYLLFFLIVVFGLIIMFDCLSKFGMFEGLENQEDSPDTAVAVPPPVDTVVNPDTTVPPPAGPAINPEQASAPPAKTQPKKKLVAKKTPIKSHPF
jgi:hypothetical protein